MYCDLLLVVIRSMSWMNGYKLQLTEVRTAQFSCFTKLEIFEIIGPQEIESLFTMGELSVEFEVNRITIKLLSSIWC